MYVKVFVVFGGDYYEVVLDLFGFDVEYLLLGVVGEL